MQANPIIYNEIKDYFKLGNGNLWGLQRGKWNPVYLNKPNNQGYLTVRFKGGLYFQHRLIYCLHTEQDIPVNLFIDHLNGNPTDNRVVNLRLVTHRENQQNKGYHRQGGLVGAQYRKCGKNWKTMLRLADGRYVSLGYFNTELEANTRYLEALKLIHLTKEEIQKHFNVAQFTSKLKGVSWHKSKGKWRACITVNGKSKHLDYFDNEEEAYNAYLKFKGGMSQCVS